MIENISDIEILALQCRSENSKLYIEEAIRCYRAGAYRASIVSTWIAVVFDLVDKIRELSVNGDAAATTIHTRFESYLAQIDAGNEQGIKSALEFERTILKTCRDSFQLFDQHQFTDLDRLRDDRHRCAHPSFQRMGQPYQPSPEQARLHLRNAVHHVLALPPIQGKAALTTLRTLITSQYFPLDAEKAAVQLRASPLGRPTPSLLRGFIDMLIFDFVTEGRDLFGKKQVCAALAATFAIFPGEVEPRVTQQLGKVIIEVPDQQLPFAITLLTHVIWAWDGLSMQARDKVNHFTQHSAAPDVIPCLHGLHRIPSLQTAIEARICQFSADELAAAIVSGAELLTRPRALEILSEVKSWNQANDVMTRIILPLFDVMTKDDLTRIIQMPRLTGADLIGAHAFSTFIKKVAASDHFETRELCLLLEENGAGYLTAFAQPPEATPPPLPQDQANTAQI